MTKTSCARCETLPHVAKDANKLYLWPPSGHSQAKLKVAAGRFANVQGIENGLLADFSDTSLAPLLTALDEALTRGEQTDTYCLLFAGDEPPTLQDFGGVTSLRKLIGLNEADWLLDVLTAKRLSTHFQPIINANSPTIPFAHECLLRWQDEEGQLRSPYQLFETAREAELLFQLDRQARETNIRNAAAHKVQSKIFLNFAPTAIYDPRNCLQSTMAVVEEVGLSPSDVVFEVVETDKVDDAAHLKSIMDYYKEHGFGIALDDLGAGFSTLQLLGELMPNYVKLDMGLVRDVHQNRFRSELVRQIIELAHRFDIEVIAEGVEVFGEAAWLRSQGVDYLQGFYFAKPGPEPVHRLDRRQKP